MDRRKKKIHRCKFGLNKIRTCHELRTKKIRRRCRLRRKKIRKLEFELPIEIIQHIQSFLDAKEAAKTGLLSKYWYNAWSTRPILDFSRLGDIYINKDDAEIRREYVLTTMNRYKELGLKLDKLAIQLPWMSTVNPPPSEFGTPREHKNNMTGFIHTLIEEASTLGVKELACYYLGFSAIYHYFPNGVFKITTLTKLSVHAICNINGGRVQCLRLVSLSLHRVRIHGNAIKEILRACPLIETLDLSHLGPHKTYLGNNVDDMLTDDDIVLCPHLASLTLHDVRMSDFSVIGDILSGSPMIERLDFDGGKASDSVLPAHVFALESITTLSVRHCKIQIDDGRILCSNLRSLDFCSIQIGDDSIRYIFLACPLVENLKMDECYGMSNINVSNLHNLVSLRVASCYSVMYRPAEVSFGSGSISVPEFHRLCYVVLKKVRVHKDFFTELSSKFPRIEDLLLDECSGYKHILQIPSPSQVLQVVSQKRIAESRI